MPRVIRGSAKSKNLDIPDSRETRVLTDRLKTTLFDLIGDDWLNHSLIIDLYAGAGSFGIEALSRGGEIAIFVENNPKVSKILESNIKKTGFYSPQKTLNVISDVYKFLETLDFKDHLNRANKSINNIIIFADPPFSKLDQFDLARLVNLIEKRFEEINPNSETTKYITPRTPDILLIIKYPASKSLKSLFPESKRNEMLLQLKYEKKIGINNIYFFSFTNTSSKS